jgi:hypothetical protein
VVFEVLAVLLPITKAGKLAQLHKSELLTKVLNANVLPQRFALKMNLLKAGLSTTKMCFVASTLVLCQVEGAARLEPIEGLESLAQVHSELKVWARDEFTGEEGWKRPIAWFTTHPEELFTLSVDTDGDGEPDEELTGTGEHPFWVEDYRSFVPMRDLRPGMRLALAQKGKVAIVTGNVSIRGPPGETFTTYNFEVEDFHTYFVGESGVWVHNSGAFDCSEMFSVFRALRGPNGDIWDTFRGLTSNPPLGWNHWPDRWKLRLMNRVRDRHFRTGGETGRNPPWQIPQVRNPGITTHNSTELGRNLARTIGLTDRPKGFSAHHIVPDEYPAARSQAMHDASVRANAVLGRHSINANDAANGTFLPNRYGNGFEPDVYGPGHTPSNAGTPNIHTAAYYEQLATRLELAEQLGGAMDVRDELQRIAFELINGNFPQ